MINKIFRVVIKLFQTYGLKYTLRDLFSRIISLKYRFTLDKFGTMSIVMWKLSIIKTGTIKVWNFTRIECYFKKSHFSSLRGWSIVIGNEVYMNNGIIIESWWNNVFISNNVKVWPNVTILAKDHHWSDYWIPNKDNMDIIIWKNVWLWANSIILPWVAIWENTVVW